MRYEILNFTPHDIDVYRMKDVKRERSDYRLKDPNAMPLVTIPSKGMARASFTEVPAGKLGSIPLVSQTFSEPAGLPKPTAGVYYVVSHITARAAALYGRTTHDLLVTARIVRDEQGRIIGCAAFSKFESE